MKKIYALLLLGSLSLVGCSSDDDSPAQVFDLNATGVISDQTPEEARNTINGKWTVGGSAAKATTSKGFNCSFIGIEFTDDRFVIAIGLPEDDFALAYGTYQMREDSNGNVEAVELYENVDGTNVKIATLTNVEVEESGSELRATFDVVFNIPDNYEDWPCGDSLSGNYSAEKEEPVNSADEADEDSNFAKIVNTWEVTGYTSSEGGTLNDIYSAPCDDIYDEIYQEVFEDIAQPLFETRLNNFIQENGEAAATQEVIDALLNEVIGEVQEEVEIIVMERIQAECEFASRIEVSFSAYGSYIFSFLGQDGDNIGIYVDSWEFNNADQTELLVDGESILTIESISNTTLVVTSQDEGDGFTDTITFTKVN